MPEGIGGQDHACGGLQKGPDRAEEISHCLLILKQNQPISQSVFCFHSLFSLGLELDSRF
jgi:hypothetical protein